jgi:hypothetical protein
MIHDSKASHTARETRVQGGHSATTYSPKDTGAETGAATLGCWAVLFVTVLCCTLVIIRHMMSAGQSKFSVRLQGGVILKSLRLSERLRSLNRKFLNRDFQPIFTRLLFVQAIQAWDARIVLYHGGI